MSRVESQERIPKYTSSLLLWSFILALIPPLSLVLALSTKSLFLLQYVHVTSGGVWTGFDLFMSVILGRILASLDLPGRVEIAKRLTPTTFFIMPSLAATAITAGVYLAQSLGVFDLRSPWIIAAGVIVLILSAQGFGVFMPNGMRIFMELAKPNPDRQKIAKLNGINIKLSGVQGVMQIAIIFVMAHIAVYPP
ncbi:hypothetical protein B9P99_04885 [Candidatus Marsarchaeota G1 archaeon OSP_B]|uniref:DUF4149 domain-containing protein n=3 Tax=Candidatus Marsarchaeota group 1 TaxID=2203770 RepID=A0A2R6A8L7_9ARCH|nr:MAG: hypothetical protein B9Q01_07260 [Candidatus Marsarchaeota G1 archaeon OSP_D]PSN87576.1 MAG: hypothetical protein B9Q00_08435 [Candidatus Marsarchaeota G1 archaeon OSP_C]PSN90290.1 MAG: hypothetical protein B9P99_04885 [Candidatus Marsarchaeota G1 archaeon OSP_B]